MFFLTMRWFSLSAPEERTQLPCAAWSQAAFLTGRAGAKEDCAVGEHSTPQSQRLASCKTLAFFLFRCCF